MKSILLTIFAILLFINSNGQANDYWQQKVNYKIYATLDDSAHAVKGFITIEYINNSPDTLQKIILHLWPNAYQNDRTAFSEQLLENGNTDFYFSADTSKGYIDKLEFKIDQKDGIKTTSGKNIDILEIALPDKLLPGNKTIIESPFYTKLPYVFSRSGHIGQTYQITQWYPKPAVYDKKGWHPMPYLDQGEFYSEFGNYDISITLPKKYKVASTGVLTDSITTNDTTILRFSQNNVHDFAWFADKEFQINRDTLMLKSGKIIGAELYHYADSTGVWSKGMNYLKNAIRSKSEWIGEYPYSKVAVVEGRLSDWGGMEYPMVTIIEKANSANELQSLINHEVGHNWFYGILGNNERDFPWMDEGMNSYYDKRYQSTYNKVKKKELPSFIGKRIPENFESLMMETVCKTKMDQPISTTSYDFNALNYGLIAYQKTAKWMQQIAEEMGESKFDSMMGAYFETWKFKHPYPEDFKSILKQYLPERADYYFQLLDRKGFAIKHTKKSFKLMSIFSLKDAEKYNYLFLLPIAGYNKYDGMQAGLILHNYTIPLPRLQYIAIPLWGLKSKAPGGLGRITMAFYPDKQIKRIETSLSFSHFSNNTFTDSLNNIKTLAFSKIVPEIKISFSSKNERSTLNRYLILKSYFLSESTVSFSRDTINNQNLIDYPAEKSAFHLLRYCIENNRKLYPYHAIFNVEKAKSFAKLSITANAFFNYPSKGGLWMRFFAGKFQYLQTENNISKFATERYHLNMTGANGYEDYTYSNWFLGRNEFEGFSSKQIMIRDGGFKIRTDLLSNKIGKTDNWLATMNFSTTLPEKINPLSVLPIKIPLRLFADVGTNDLCWRKNTEIERVLYDAGIEFVLLNDLIHFYFPLVYSKSFRNYVNSVYPDKKIVRTMSFSINLQSISIKRFFPQSPF
jgi:hypothetical protein